MTWPTLNSKVYRAQKITILKQFKWESQLTDLERASKNTNKFKIAMQGRILKVFHGARAPLFWEKFGWLLSSLQLLLQKARHRDSDPAAAATAAATVAALAQFLKALYFRRWNTWMLHTLYIDASCYEVSVSHMSNVLDLIFMVQ